MQSIPYLGLFSVIYKDLASATDLIGSNPEFSAKTVGICSKASAKALTAYYSTLSIWSDSSCKCNAQANSQLPPPYTILLHLIRFLTLHKASWIDL